MFKDITASLVAATRKVVEASSAKAADEAARKEQASNLSRSMKPAYEGMAPRNAQERSLISEKKSHTVPKTDKEKDLASLAEPKDKITHADVMLGRGVKKEEKMPEKKTSAFDYKSPRKPQDAPNRKSGDVTSTGHNVKKISTGTVYTKKFEEVEQIDEISTKLLAKAAHSASDPSKHYDDDEKYHDAQKFADHAKKTKDAKSAAAVQGAADAKGHYPRPNQARGYDSLAYRSPSRVTAAGKANKQDIKTLKSKLKNEELDAISEAPVDGVAPGSLENDGHLCASKVMHKEWKEGTTLFSQHAEPNEIGLIEWYDVMFEHGIEKKVPTRDLEIMVSESHMNHTKKKKM